MRSRLHSAHGKWLSRFGWLALIWTISIAALGVIAMILRAIMSAAGMTT